MNKMDYNQLAELLFPEIEKTPNFWEEKYPLRELPAKAEVTRYAPSPTGFVHFGALYTSLINVLMARKTQGVVFLRIEDTDKKRELEGAVNDIVQTLKSFDLNFDEGVNGQGEYGPYVQSERMEIYKTFAKELVRQGKAYPCFCSETDLEQMRTNQEKSKQRFGYYGEFAQCRSLSFEQIKGNIQNKKKFVLRFKSPYTVQDRIKTFDLIRGEREIPQNENDVIILKSNGLPPYNFAHIVDDHLMRTTLVVRGDEWLASLVEHLQLFEALGWTPPKYAHIAPIQKIDENENRRKLSKRKDPEANVQYFAERGYPAQAVKDYLMTLANSDFEDWRLANPKASILDFPFDITKMNTSGALFDLAKLDDISKNYISLLSAKEVYDFFKEWAEIYNPNLLDSLNQNKDYWIAILDMDREIAKPRKDLSYWSEIEPTYRYMFEDGFDERVGFPAQFEAKDKIGRAHV